MKPQKSIILTTSSFLLSRKNSIESKKLLALLSKMLCCCFLLFLNLHLSATGKSFNNEYKEFADPAGTVTNTSLFSSGGTTTGTNSVCNGINTGIINLSGQSGSVIRWEQSTDVGVTWNPISNTGTSQVYNNLTQTTKYRAVVQNGVATPLYSTIATITVTPVPSASINYAGSPYCSSLASASVTRTGTTGGTYSSTSGLTISSSSGKITISTSTPGSYIVTYAIAPTGGCGSFTTTASITITAAPVAAISYSGSSFCSNASVATVTRTGTAGGTFSSTSGLAIDPVTGDITPATSTPGSYTVRYTIVAAGGCSVYTATTPVTIGMVASASISYAGSPYCGNTLTATVTRIGTAGGNYSSTPGLFINSITGKITIGSSTAGTYTVTYTIAASGGCDAFSTSTSITIFENPSATISYAGNPYCSNGGTATVSRTGSAGGVYSSTAGLSINPSTGDINLDASTVGTYTVNYTVTPSGGCTIYTRTTSVTISTPLSATIIYNGNPYCSDGGIATVTRTGSAIGTYSSAAGLNISSTTGKITLATSVAGTYTVSYTLISGGCTTIATAPVTINATPSATIHYDGNSFCPYGGIATVTRIGTEGGLYSSTSGLEIDPATGDITFAASIAGTYTITYSIAPVDNCPGFSTSTIITLYNQPMPPVAFDQQVCSNGDNTQTLTATATGGTITWYDEAEAGNVVASPVQTGVGTVTYYAEASNGGCISAVRKAVTLTINAAPAAPVSNGDQSVCSDGSISQTLTATASSPDAITWYDAAAGGNIIIPQQVGPGSNSYYAQASNGTCNSPVRTQVTLTINPVLATPGPISGLLNVCPMIGSATPTTYSINPVAGASSYTWQVPLGTALISGQGTTSIQVTFDNSFAYTHSIFTVIAESNSCTSAASELEVLKILPGIATSINGPANVCEFIGSTANAVYSVDPVENATSYTWTVSGSASIVSGQGTTNVEISFLDSFNYGSIKVTANSNCGNRAARSLSISIYAPATPGSITGLNSVCSFVGTGTTVGYSIRPAPNAVSYLWTVPDHVTLMSGQGTTDITVTFDSGYTTSLIKVRSVGSCVSSNDRSLLVNTPAGLRPGIISGPVNACVFINSGNEATYTIKKVLNAGAYLWSVPTGATITSHPGGNNENDTIIKVTYDDSFIAGSKISVQSISCIPGNARTLTISRTLPSKPGSITGSVNVCEFMASASNPGGLPVTYTIQKFTSAQSYIWTAPEHAAITRHPAGAGINDTIVEITYDSDFVQGTLSVAVANGCGAGIARTLSVTRATPGSISNIQVTQVSTCPDRTYTYTLLAMPSNATSILWTIPADGMLVSGQGTISVTISYPSAKITGTVTARAYNNCSFGTLRTMNINLPVCTTEFGRMITGPDKIAVPAIQGEFKAKVFPNPVISDFKIAIVSVSQEPMYIRITDMLGNEMKRIVAVSKEIVVHTNDLNKGTYLVEITQGKNKTVEKFIKL
ncbi:MAG: T9SS type A sorting domain-containing protein [Ferruginibacter sp.]